MKKVFTLITVMALVVMIQAADVQLVVQKIDNHGAVPGNTYRVYAHMPTAEHTLHIVYGDLNHPLSIESTAPFFQSQYAGHSAANISEELITLSPTMRYDSWITLGYDNSTSNDMWDVGVDFSDFDGAGTILANNGGWFLIPTDEKVVPNANGLVLIGQFTTTGVATGTLNLQGWTAPQSPWRAEGLTFSTSHAQVFGCMDSKASNYNVSATYDDGTCASAAPTTATAHNSTTARIEKQSNWDVFPNPLRDNLINVQFRNNLDLKNAATRIDIIDMTGKLVGSHSISADAVLPGNRVTLTQDLAAGSYKVVLIQGTTQESKTLIKEK